MHILYNYECHIIVFSVHFHKKMNNGWLEVQVLCVMCIKISVLFVIVLSNVGSMRPLLRPQWAQALFFNEQLLTASDEYLHIQVFCY